VLLIHEGCHADWINIVDIRVSSPLTVDGALHSLNGEELEAPSTPHIISSMGFEWLLHPPLWLVGPHRLPGESIPYVDAFLGLPLCRDDGFGLLVGIGLNLLHAW
jgi:hypothetical protein